MRVFRRILFGAGVAGFILCCATVLLFNRPTLGWQALSVPTGSMRPTFTPGSLVLSHRVAISSLKVGDIITYTNPLTMRSTLTHRIIKVYKIDGKIPAFITKGDANPSPDPPVVGGLVQGQMVWHVPYVGDLLMWAKTWTGIAILIYLPALLVIIEETRRLADYLRQMKPYSLRGTPSSKGAAPLGMRSRLALAGGSLAGVLIVGAAGFDTVQALSTITSNTVSLAPNTLAVAASTTTPPSTTTTTTTTQTNTSCTSDTHVNVNDSSSQSGTTGNAFSQNGNATSGNVSNTNTTQTTITVTGC